MQITHFGHSCVLLDTGAARLLIDPGTFSSGFEDLTGLDAVLVTHQHPDHLDPDRLPGLLRSNPDARLIVDPGTAEQLDADHETVEPGATVTVGGARVEVLGGRHAVIHPDIPVIPNNVYLVDGTHLHPGDSLSVVPGDPPEVLFLPTAAPWQKLADAVDYLRRGWRSRSTRGSSRSRACTTATSSVWARRRRRCGSSTPAPRSRSETASS
jgi:L-ascorbate metabolism protein UlaG (beta-lactamase superfamily)